MSGIAKDLRLSSVHARMLERFDRVWSSSREERLQCLNDRRFTFVAGAQWEGQLGEQFENKPRFEMNKMRKAVGRIISEYRQNRVDAKFIARKASPASDSAAEMATSKYRAGCSGHVAKAATDNAFEEAAAGGMGAWRLCAAYEDARDPANEHQDIEWAPIYDADVRVFMDDNALLPDKSDSKWGFIITPYTHEAFEEAWPDEDPATWTVEVTQREFDWCTRDIVYVAEYYEIRMVKAELTTYVHLDGNEQRISARDLEADPGLINWLSAVGARKTAQRMVDMPEVHKYLGSGSKILKDCGRIPGEYIPIIITYGHRAVVDSVERIAGAVRIAKDPQRLKNVLTSKLAEIAAAGSSRKPIFYPEQMKGHTTLWAEDNVKNHPYLLINKMTDPATGQIVAGPATYLEPPNVPEALGALIELSEFDIKDLLGSTEQAEKVVANVSEQTMGMVQQQIDLHSHIYISSFQRAERYAGLVWLSMAKELYVEKGRKVIGQSADGEQETFELMKRSIDKKSGAAFVSSDMPGADLELEITYGPSTASKRTSTVRDLKELLAVVKDPETVAILEAITLMNLEGEGLSDTRRYFRRKLIALGAVEPTEEEAKDMAEEQAGKPEDAQSSYLRAAAENEVAKAIKARADTLLALARAEQARAEAAATGATVDREDINQLAQLSDQLAAGQPGSPQAPSQPASLN